MTRLQLRHVLSVGLPVGCQPPLLDGLDHLHDLGRVNTWVVFPLIWRISPRFITLSRHGSLEGAVADKIDDGVELMIATPSRDLRVIMCRWFWRKGF